MNGMGNFSQMSSYTKKSIFNRLFVIRLTQFTVKLQLYKKLVIEVWSTIKNVQRNTIFCLSFGCLNLWLYMLKKRLKIVRFFKLSFYCILFIKLEMFHV